MVKDVEASESLVPALRLSIKTFQRLPKFKAKGLIHIWVYEGIFEVAY